MKSVSLRDWTSLGTTATLHGADQIPPPLNDGGGGPNSGLFFFFT